MLMNRSNLTLSANTFGLNLVTRSLAQNSGLINLGATQSLRVRHSHHERMADVMRVDVVKDAPKYQDISKSPISIWIEILGSSPTIGSSLRLGSRCVLSPSMRGWPQPAQGQWSAIQPPPGRSTATPRGSTGLETRVTSDPVMRPIARFTSVAAARGANAARASAKG